MPLILIWPVLCVVVAIAAAKRGRSAIAWFVLAMVISPLVAGLLVLALGKRESFGAGWRGGHPDGPIRITRDAQE